MGQFDDLPETDLRAKSEGAHVGQRRAGRKSMLAHIAAGAPLWKAQLSAYAGGRARKRAPVTLAHTWKP